MKQVVFNELKSRLRDKNNNFIFDYLKRNKIEIRSKPWIGCSIVRKTFIEYVVLHTLPHDVCRLISMRNNKTNERLKKIYLDELSSFDSPPLINNFFLDHNDVLGFALYARLFDEKSEEILKKYFPKTYEESMCIYIGRHK